MSILGFKDQILDGLHKNILNILIILHNLCMCNRKVDIMLCRIHRRILFCINICQYRNTLLLEGKSNIQLDGCMFSMYNGSLCTMGYCCLARNICLRTNKGLYRKIGFCSELLNHKYHMIENWSMSCNDSHNFSIEGYLLHKNITT